MSDPTTIHIGVLAVIGDFTRMQAEAVALLERHLQVPPRIKAIDWAVLRNQWRDAHRLHEVFEVFKPHGFGVEIRLRSLHVDFDFCRSGRPGGFDAWRLYNHTLNHPGRFIALDQRAFDQAITALLGSGVIEEEENLTFMKESAAGGAFPRIGRMASGTDAILLQACSQETFVALATTWASFLGGVLSELIEGPGQSQCHLALEGGRFWLAYDDFQDAISIEPRDDASARLVPMILARARRMRTVES